MKLRLKFAQIFILVYLQVSLEVFEVLFPGTP